MRNKERNDWIDNLSPGDPPLAICFNCKHIHEDYTRMGSWMLFNGYNCKIGYRSFDRENWKCNGFVKKDG